jgi:hypothetical protein
VPWHSDFQADFYLYFVRKGATTGSILAEFNERQGIFDQSSGMRQFKLFLG